MESSDYLIALNMVNDLGCLKIKRLLKVFKRAKDVFSAQESEIAKVAGVNRKIVGEIKKVLNSKEFKEELLFIEKQKIKVITILDEDYPSNLKNIYAAPALLYVKGSLLKNDSIALSVVGSREASDYGLKAAERLSFDMAKYKITVVSGLARGIDTHSHIGALKGGGRTIAVLGSGLDVIYPPENIRLYQRIKDKGAVISEFPVFTPPNRQNFPRRNRIISGLSLGVVVVEAKRRSGSLITADLALEQGREVFALPGNAGSLTSQGTNHLIRQGAKLIENLDDIIEELQSPLKDYFNLKG